MSEKKKVSKWVGESGFNPKTHWRSKPIPFGMLVRGYLPKFLGGEMVYDAVVRTDHFKSDTLLMSYLLEQGAVAAGRGADFHENAIAAHVERLRERRREQSSHTK